MVAKLELRSRGGVLCRKRLVGTIDAVGMETQHGSTSEATIAAEPLERR
jgi:hypothetical protein